MNSLFDHFQQRADGDQLDVARLLHAGLTEGRDRIVLAYEGRNISVAELENRVARVQAGLRRVGLRPGQRVAVMLSNSVDHIALIYALILSGVVWIPVNVRLRGAGLLHIIEHAQPKLLVYDPEFEDAIADLPASATMHLHKLLEEPDRAGDVRLEFSAGLKPGDALCIIYTSGTTGAAKGVVFTHRMLRVASEAALLVANIGAGDRAFLWEPLCHIGGAQMLMIPFLVDAQLQVVERFSASRFWTQWRSAKATHLHYLGGILDVLMQQPEAETPQKPSIGIAWGAGVTAQAWGAIQERFGCEIRECYGMTECSSFATFNASGTPGSIGAPLPWIRLDLLDEAGAPVLQGEIGEIVLSSDVEGVFLPGYLDNLEATRKTLRGGKLHTGDMARQLGNGEYSFVGRRTDSMRVRGENVSAWEVERVFVEHPAVKAAAAIGVAASIGEQDILLYVQFKPAQSLDWAELVAWASPRLATFQMPRYYAAIEAFELTPSERIRKHLLPKAVADAWDRTSPETNRKDSRHVANV
jgi:crotonobetaine/carnitine-CoA ligase